jgi:hypothetical protein
VGKEKDPCYDWPRTARRATGGGGGGGEGVAVGVCVEDIVLEDDIVEDDMVESLAELETLGDGDGLGVGKV